MFGCLHVSESDLQHLVSNLQHFFIFCSGRENPITSKIIVSFMENWINVHKKKSYVTKIMNWKSDAVIYIHVHGVHGLKVISRHWTCIFHMLYMYIVYMDLRLFPGIGHVYFTYYTCTWCTWT